MKSNRYEINEYIPGIEVDDDILFSRWLETARADYHKWVSEFILNKQVPRCHLALAVRAYDSRMTLSKNVEMHQSSDYYFLNQDMVRSLNSFYSENLWNNLERLEKIPYCEKIVSVYGGIIRFAAEFETHEKHNSSKFRSEVLNNLFENWPAEKVVPPIFSHDIPNDNNARIFECDFSLLSKMVHLSKNEDDKMIWAKEMAYRYITKKIKLSKEQLSIISSIIKGKNFQNLIKDNVFLTYSRGPVYYLKNSITSSDEDIFHLFGYKNKDLKRALFSKANTEMVDGEKITTLDLSVMTILPRIKDVRKQQILAKVVNSYDKDHPQIDSIEEICESISHLNLFLNEDQEANFIYSCLNGDASIIQDTQSMIKTLSVYRYPSYDPSIFLSEFMNKFRKKMSSLNKVHDWLSLHVVNKNSIKFRQEKLEKINGISFKNNKIHIPSHNNELVDAGSKMMICVGNGSYLDRILQKKSMIFFINNKEGQTEFCVEIDFNFNVLQAMGIRNKPMSDKDLSDLVFLLETKVQNKNPTRAFFKKIINKYFLYGNAFILGVIIMILLKYLFK